MDVLYGDVPYRIVPINPNSAYTFMNILYGTLPYSMLPPYGTVRHGTLPVPYIAACERASTCKRIEDYQMNSTHLRLSFNTINVHATACLIHNPFCC